MPGCRVEDMGLKIGLNGIDNAKILFDKVRIPRTNMLTSYAEVTADGKYVWKENGGKAPSKRAKHSGTPPPSHTQIVTGHSSSFALSSAASKTLPAA